MKKIDMLGKKFGSLLVIEEVPKTDDIPRYDLFWKCRCDCGKECVMPGKTLRKNYQHTCPECREINAEGEFQFFPHTYRNDPYVIERHTDYFLYQCRAKSGGRFLVDRKFYDEICKYNWYMDKKGNVYYSKNINKKKHRRALSHFLLDITDDKTVVKHLNGDPRDYRLENLHKCALGKTAQGATIPKNHSTGFKGVKFDKRYGTYPAYIYPDGQAIHLGTFKTAQQAADAYDKAAIQYYGVMALTNAEIKRREKESRILDPCEKTGESVILEQFENLTETENDEKYMFYWCSGGRFLTDREFKDKLSAYKWVMNKSGHVTASVDKGKWTNKLNLSHYLLDLPDDDTLAVMHINGVATDYRKENLLVGKRGDIVRRGGLRSTNKTGYKGVQVNKKYGYIHAAIRANGKNYHLGTFKTLEEAATAYDEAAIKHFGLAALTNAEIQRRKNSE